VRATFLLFTGLTVVFAGEPAKNNTVTMTGDGFALVQTLVVTNGRICRKLDRHSAPFPLAWHLKPAWNAIYLEIPELDLIKSTICQQAISQETLVGPLAKGTWQIYTGARISRIRTATFTGKKEIRPEKGKYTLTTTGGIIAITAGFHGGSGPCHEYVPLLVSIEGNRIFARMGNPLIPHPIREGSCRAVSQTHAQGAVNLPAGSYTVEGEHITGVAVYETSGE
jgi:hypothetical protein